MGFGGHTRADGFSTLLMAFQRHSISSRLEGGHVGMMMGTPMLARGRQARRRR